MKMDAGDEYLFELDDISTKAALDILISLPSLWFFYRYLLDLMGQ